MIYLQAGRQNVDYQDGKKVLLDWKCLQVYHLLGRCSTIDSKLEGIGGDEVLAKNTLKIKLVQTKKLAYELCGIST
jgi:hypothetical protein